jgi:hypothetical protein
MNEEAFKEALGAETKLSLADLGKGRGGKAVKAVPRGVGRYHGSRGADGAKKCTQKLGYGSGGGGGLEPLLEPSK